MGADLLERRALHALPAKPRRARAAAHEDRVESGDSTDPYTRSLCARPQICRHLDARISTIARSC